MTHARFRLRTFARMALAALAVVACACVLASTTDVEALAATSSLKAGEPSDYKIVYKLNGGTQAKGQRLSVKLGKKLDIAKIKRPTRKGYAFKGWYADSRLSKKAKSVTGDKAKSSRTLYAKWKLETYSIKLKPCGGKLKENYAGFYTMKSRTIELPKPVRIGYQFMGWYRSMSSGARVKKIEHGSAGDKVLYAKWAPIIYSIAYFTDGGTLEKGYAKRFSRQNTSVKIPSPKKKGYAFMGWYADAAHTKRVFTVNPKSKSNKILYAKWRKRELIAHRGYFADGAVENSIASLKAAKKRGFEIAEMDVRFTVDGMPIVFHDENIWIARVDACGDKEKVKVPINSLTYEELQTAKKSGAISGVDGRNVATIEEMLEAAKKLDIDVCIHLKTSQEAQLQTLIEYVEGCGMGGRVCWASGFFDALAYIEEWYGEDARLIYMHAITKECLANIKNLQAGGAEVVLLRHQRFVTKKAIKACKEASVPLGVWGFDNEKAALASSDPYVSTFMINGLKAKKVPKLLGK